MTWLFVSASPDGVMIMPVPAAAPPSSWVLMLIVAGATWAATLEAVASLDPSAVGQLGASGVLGVPLGRSGALCVGWAPKMPPTTQSHQSSVEPLAVWV